MNYDKNNCIFNTNAKFRSAHLRRNPNGQVLMLDEPPEANACLKL